MEVTVSRKKEIENDIFSQGNLVIHKTHNLVLLVLRSFKDDFKGVVIDSGSCRNGDSELLKMGLESTYSRHEFKQFYGIITLSNVQVED